VWLVKIPLTTVTETSEDAGDYRFQADFEPGPRTEKLRRLTARLL